MYLTLYFSPMKTPLRLLVTLSLLASSMLFAQPASAVANPYSSGNGNVACITDGEETGYFTIVNNVVTGQTYCSGSVTIPDGVTAIGGDGYPTGFGGARALTSVIIPNSVTAIGDWSFYEAGIASINIPDSVRTIGRGAFFGMSSLTSVNLGNGVTTIGPIAFNSTSLSSLTIPNSVTSFPLDPFNGINGAFGMALSANTYQYCGTALTSAVLGDAGLYSKSNSCAPAIGTLYNSNTRSGDVACTTGYFTIVNNVVTKYQGCVGAVNIPSGVTAISNSAFDYAIGVTSVVMPNTVTTIGASAFARNWGLTSLTLGNSITSIGNKAFANAQELTSLIIPNSVTSIGAEAFNLNFALTSLTIGSSVVTIGSYAFSSADRITTLIIPNSVTTIGSSAFGGMTRLTSLTLGSSVTTIGDYAFNQTQSLVSLTIPRSVASIGQRAFGGANSFSTYQYCGRSLSASDFINAGLLESQTNTCIPSITTPNAPTSIVATSTGPTTASVAFTAPTDDGGSPIIRYSAASSTDRRSGTVSQAGSGTISITGLTPGTSYTFSVVAINAIGASNNSSPSNAVPEVSSSSSSSSSSSNTATITAGTITDSKVATFASGVTEAVIPATAALPAVKLNFAGTAPTAVTVVPMSSNPAPLTATPFRVTGSTKIVDIQITGAFNGVATVCLDGASTDSVFHYTGTPAAWVELANRSYSNGQICGDTTSFSPFTAAPANTNPSAPGSVIATATGKRSATVSFTAPTSDGGSVITSYTVISTPGSITKTLTQSVSGAFNVTGLQPGTSYTFSVTATNAIGTSAGVTSNSIKTTTADIASLSSVTFTDDGSGTAGKLAWSGKNIDAVLYTGPASSYPGPFNFGAFSTSWNGSVRNLTPATEYTISIYAISVDGIGESKSITFKTGAKSEVVKNLNYWNTWLTANTFVPGEAASISNLLSKFNLLETSPHRAHIKVPTSRVSKVEVTSLTPASCSVVSATAKVDAGLVKALTTDKCTISYTVTGASKAPATLVKDFIFKKVTK
jgi:hypothetical protein